MMHFEVEAIEFLDLFDGEVHIFDGSNRNDGVAMETGGGTDWKVGKEIILRADVASLRCLLGIQVDVQESSEYICPDSRGVVQVKHIH